MARRKPRAEEQPRELTRKETRLHAHQRQRNRKIMTWSGVALGLALLLVVIGLVSEFIIMPNSAVATVGETQLITRDFRKRVFLEQNRLQNQMLRMSQLEQQFGGQGFFASQINQLQATLSSPFTLGIEVLDQMIREEVVRQQAAARNISVTDAEIDEALREEVAAQQGAVTVPQATSTAEAAVEATTTADSWTPTPTATVDASGVVTATATPLPTPVLPTPLPIITDEQYIEGLAQLETNLRDIANMTLVEYRQIVASRLLNEKLTEVIGDEQVEPTTEQVFARHILLEITEPVTPTTEITSTTGITEEEITEDVVLTSTSEVTTAEVITAEEVAPVEAVTGTDEVTSTETVTEDATGDATEAVTDTAGITEPVVVTETIVVTETVTVTDTVTDTDNITESTAMTGTDAISDTVTELSPAATPEPRDEAQTLALAQEIRQRLLAGEDFAALAAEYSSDTTSAVNGGDLGWFGRGAMVAPFEEAAFALEPGEISEPIRSDFGYHIIEVLEKDADRPKDQATLEQERTAAYETWLQEQIAATPIERPSDLVSKLPPDLEVILPQSAPAPVDAAPAPLAPAAPITQ